jgi:hypothetical protein
VTTQPSDDVVSDEELAALALAANPDAAVADDAVNLWDLVGQDEGLLPDWYMPPVSAGRRNHPRWRRRITLMIICAFLTVNACGLCATYGYLAIA